MKLKPIIDFLESFAPKKLAFSWDKVGLQLKFDKEIKKILVLLDVTEENVDFAVKNDIDLIVAHHPLIFRDLASIDFTSPFGKTLAKLIKAKINVFIMHTNLDCAKEGVNYQLARHYDLNPYQCEVLEPVYYEALYKFAVYVPVSHQAIIRKALADSGAGNIGDYSNCTFNISGIGTFLGKANTNPFIGEKNKLTEVAEIKIETIVPEFSLEKVKKAVLAVHPYQEVAYDVYKLEQINQVYGLGLIGLDKNKKKIAVCGGSGGALIKKAFKMGAENYITGEVSYHDLLEAKALGLKVDLIGHSFSEKVVIPYLVKILKDFFLELVIIDNLT